MKKIKKSIIVIIMLVVFLTGCGEKKKSNSVTLPDNEIISYSKIDTTKTIIRITNTISATYKELEKAIEDKFPNVEVITDIGSGYFYLEEQAKNNDLSDIVFSTRNADFSEYLYDLSSLSVTNRYNLTALQSLSVEGRIYQFPIASSGVGIFYNKTLFEKNGWNIPQDITEFYELCETISAAGIRPFAPCLKYASTVSDVGIGFSSSKIFTDLETSTKFYDFIAGKRSSEGVLEPYLETLRTLYQKGIIVDEDFTSSATTNRKMMYNGQVAMIPYSLNFVSFYDIETDEHPECELGFMGFPTETYGERTIAISNDGACMSLSKASMEDNNKRDLLLQIIDYLSTSEGHDVLYQCFSGITSLKNYQSSIISRFDEISNCMDLGRMYYQHQIWTNDDMDIIKEWITTDMEISEMLQNLDKIIYDDLNEKTEYEVIGQATKTFSVMETCAFMADSFRETTGADIGLVLYKTQYKGIIMKLYGGDITLPDIFYIRGVSSRECLTVYEITGKDLKLLLEHPYVDGKEENVTYVPSGLQMTYAPWNDMDNNVVSVTLADGTPIDDNKVYKVAAWDTTIGEQYISNVFQRYEQYNSSVAYMREIIKQKQIISPANDGRIILKWD